MKLLFVMKSSKNVECESIVAYILCKKDNGDILKNTIIDELQASFKLIIKPILISNHQVSIDNQNVTGDLAFLVILLGKECSSSTWCFKCELYPKVCLKRGHKIGEDWTMNALILVSESNSTGLAGHGVKESPIWDFFEVDKYICPVLHNQINLTNNVLHTLLD